MDFHWAPEYRAFRDELRAFIREWRTPELLREYAETYGGGGDRIARFHRAIDERGWMRMCWPVEVGGGGRDMLYQYVFVEEMEYWGMPYGNLHLDRAVAAGLRLRGPEAGLPAGHLPGRAVLRPRLQRAERGDGPGGAAHPGRA
jgi:alkylation response protein AidB-like acyl-CoA dehydrogenase